MSSLDNPKDIIGSTKVPISLWPEIASVYGCIGLLDGKGKYGRGNYRATPVRASIYYEALRRHMAKWFSGEELDSDSGIPHLAHALACIAILVDAKHANTLIDDRNYNDGYRDAEEYLSQFVTALIDKHKDRNPKHYSIQDDS
jgi:Domain of unknown function (DUF5664)